MPKGKKAKGKTVPDPAVIKKQEAKKVVYLFKKRPKNSGIRQDIKPQMDCAHFVKWFCYTGCSSKDLFSILSV